MLDSQLIFMIFRVVPRLPEDGGGGGGGGVCVCVCVWGGGSACSKLPSAMAMIGGGGVELVPSST